MMKKTKKVLGFIAITAIIGFTVFGCREDTPAHTHTAGTAATCLTPQTCTTCGDVLQAATGHNFGDDSDWADDAEAATCTHPSQDTRDCKNESCTEKDRRTGSHPTLGHNLPGAYPATCMEDGNTGTGHCSRCGEDEKGEKIPIDPDNHDFSGEPVITPAACEIAGEEVITCGNAGCDVEQKTEIKALEHDWDWTENKIAASCEHASKDTAACNNTPCTATNERTGSEPALGHDLPGAKAPTCTSTGITGIGHCNRCNEDLEGDTIPIVSDNHNFGEWAQKTPATCIAPERLIRVCSHNAAHTEEENHGEINPANHAAGCNPTSPTSTYIIIGSGTAFTTNFSYSLCGGSGTTPDQPIQNTLTAIRTHADGAAVTIQFGNGTDVLDIGDTFAGFSNTADSTWGLITLTGKITSSYGSSVGTIQLANNVSINSTADIANTNNPTGRAITNDGTGTVNILGGTLYGTNANPVIMNNTTGTVNILGGTIRTTYGTAVRNGSTGTVNISGGTIQAGVMANNSAISNDSTGTVTITGTNTVITSANTTTTSGTINNGAGGRIEISGGTVRNTDNSPDANAIRNSASGIITLRDCTVQSTNGYAIRNDGLHNRIIMDSSVVTPQGIRLLGSDHDSSVPAANCDSPHICAIAFCDYVIEPAGHKYSSLTLVNGDNITTLTGIAVITGTCSVCSFNPGQISMSLAEYIQAHSAEGTAADPVPLKVSINLGTMGTAANGWTQLLTALNTGGKLVALDLSGSTRSSNGTFSTGSTTNTPAPGLGGLRQIVSLVLPETTVTGTFESFYNCTNLTSITIPNSVTSIGQRAFYGCTGLTSITIPNSVTSIGAGAFFGCTGLTSVTIGSGVTSIGSGEFTVCTNLVSITVHVDNANFFSQDGILYNKTNNTFVLIPQRVSGSVTIPNGVTSITTEFQSRTGLTSITIPESVTSIGGSAFYGCTNLRSVTFERADTTIDNGTFPNGASLRAAYITNGGGIGTYIQTGATWVKQ